MGSKLEEIKQSLAELQIKLDDLIVLTEDTSDFEEDVEYGLDDTEDEDVCEDCGLVFADCVCSENSEEDSSDVEEISGYVDNSSEECCENCGGCVESLEENETLARIRELEEALSETEERFNEEIQDIYDELNKLDEEIYNSEC